MDCMETLFDLLDKEESAAVRAVLGHFLFVFIHPYPDGNGRIGRFLMNLMLASGGFPWAIIRLTQRKSYMNALEQASVNKDVGRLRAMWAKMRSVVVDRFPVADLQIDTETYLASLEDIYQHDAYNSLSIEGYRVTPEIIARVRRGDWDPEREADREHGAAMAAKGYFDTFRLIEEDVRAVLEGSDPAAIAKKTLARLVPGIIRHKHPGRHP